MWSLVCQSQQPQFSSFFNYVCLLHNLSRKCWPSSLTLDNKSLPKKLFLNFLRSWHTHLPQQPGLPIFSRYSIPTRGKYTKLKKYILIGHKMYQMAICKIDHMTKIYQHLPLQDPPTLTQIAIFGLKIYHLATLLTPYLIFGNASICVFVDLRTILFYKKRCPHKGHRTPPVITLYIYYCTRHLFLYFL
jgi:hypothetical protein